MIEQLGPYRIDRQIGRGGMGAVYSGVNEETGESAAIKILSAAFADDPGFRNRFLSEIETLKQLRHPNIVRLFGDGEQDGQLFYVMELVEGKSLQEELQAGHQYDWEETAEIGIQICQALKHAHDHGVIHRDLKPANLLRTLDNQIKLTDFGIAKLFGGSQLTAAGSVVGTADFMAPEQAEGLGVTYRSDLYSLGTVMFTLLARRPPFAGASLPQVVYKLRYEEAPSVRRFNPQVPSELEQIIAQLLNKVPGDRVATALVLANRLRAMKHGLAVREPDTDDAANDGTIEKPVSPPSPSDEQATRISKSARGPNTELNPTAVDEFELREDRGSAVGGPSWNDLTLATGDDVSGNALTGGVVPSSSDSGQGNDASAKTVVETQVPVNRFTTIEADQQRKKQEAIDASAKTSELIKTMVMTMCLVIAIVIIVWGLWPKSADRLYSEIIQIKATATLEDARKQIDKFLTKYPNDARAAEVLGYQLEILSERHFSNLVRRSRKETLGTLEATFVQGMRDRAENPAAARDAFIEVMRDADTADDNLDEAARYSDFAQYQLGKLSNLPSSSGEDRDAN